MGMTVNIGSFVGNLGSGNVTGNITVSDLNIEQAIGLVDQLKQYSGELGAVGADSASLTKTLVELETELKKGSPDRSLIRTLLTDVRNSLSGAAGNLIASGALNLINQLLGTGVPAA
jgi:hypothetical protein